MEKFNTIINQIDSICAKHSFKKDGLTFRFKENNSAIINIQKSRDLIEDGVKFTINIGIHFVKLKYFNTGESLKKPSFMDCQWKIRLGKLFENPCDFWWIINSQTDLDSFILQLNFFFDNLIFPEIEKRKLDIDFMELLYNKDLLGITEIERLNNLCSFFCIYDDSRLPQALEEFKLLCNKEKLGYLYDTKCSQIQIWESRIEGQDTWVYRDNSFQWV